MSFCFCGLAENAFETLKATFKLIFVLNIFVKLETECHNQTEADRRHACNQCPMKFFRPADLRNHEKKHLGIKRM